MLADYIETNRISAQILTFDEKVGTSTRAALLEKTLPGVKTILFAHAEGHTLVVLEGSKKVDIPALTHLLGVKNVHLATPDEVEAVTGYSIGGVPPISIYGTPTLIDEGVLAHAWVAAGGGDSFSLLKIQTRDIVEHAFDARVVAITTTKKNK